MSLCDRLEYASVPHRPPQFNTSVLHRDHTFSAPQIPQFNTRNPSVQHQNPSLLYEKPISSTHPSVPLQEPLSSTPKPRQFHTKNLSVQHSFCLKGVLNWGVLTVELRRFRCGTEGFSVWNWGVCGTEGVFGLEPRVFGVELRGFLCETEGCVELGGFWYGIEEFRGWKGVALLCGTDVLNWGGCGT